MTVSLLSFAQPEGSLPQVTVHGNHTLTVERIGTSKTMKGAPLERTTLTRSVSYADLDLSTYEGRSEFRQRISAAALASCNELKLLAPLQTSEAPGAETVNQDCESDAARGAQPQVDAAIAVAVSGHDDGAH
jgi:UrcA family protein